MRQEKTQKRLVTKEQYVRVLGKKITLCSVGSFLLLCGLIGFPLALLFVVLAFSQVITNFEITASNSINMTFLVLVPVVGGLSCALLWIGKSLLDDGRAIEPVKLITRNTSDQLPAEESLVRSSTEPPVDQQTQLLRAAQGGQETHQEQLLRPAQE